MNGSRKKVMIVEDNPGDARIMKDMLWPLRVETFSVLATDGEAAISILNQAYNILPDLIILDLNLPKVHGFEVLKAIRSEPEFKKIPVLIMTGSTREEDERRARELGATDFYIKPSTPTDYKVIQARLAKLLETKCVS